jgi:hypothetical protein
VRSISLRRLQTRCGRLRRSAPCCLPASIDHRRHATICSSTCKSPDNHRAQLLHELQREACNFNLLASEQGGGGRRMRDRVGRCARRYPSPIPKGGASRTGTDLRRAGLWFLATIFPDHHTLVRRISTDSAREGWLYPAEGLMWSKDKEYRKHHHCRSYQHGNPMQHRNILATTAPWTTGR